MSGKQGRTRGGQSVAPAMRTGNKTLAWRGHDYSDGCGCRNCRRLRKRAAGNYMKWLRGDGAAGQR